MIREGVLCVFLCACSLFLAGQSFQKLSGTGVSHSYTGLNGAGGSFYDWDHDGLPDLVLTQNGSSPQFYHNVGDGFQQLETPFIEDDGNIKSFSWVDFDNDGDADISLTRYEGAFSIYENDGDFNFTDISESAGLPVTSHYTYGHSWGDYDRDGDLDLYICNYHYYEAVPNYLFRNNGDGTFTEVAEEAGVDDGYQYSFQSVWCDLNFDGWQDLFIINDKESPNSLYLNNGDGTFTDQSVASGADVIIEAMSNSIADYDRDGDFDIYMTNAIQPNVLLRNGGNLNFSDYTVEAGLTVDEMCWGALFFDYDNNGWDDLLVSTVGVSNELYANQMNGLFSPATANLASQTSFTWALMKGDINMDGKEDLINIDAPPAESIVWRNITETDNHYVSFDLTGTMSNRDAFGARIEVYTNGERQMKHLCTAENYLTQNSQYLNFGLGTSEIVDSVWIAWPSGWTEKWYDLAVDQRYEITEGESLVIDFELSQESPVCSGDSIVVTAGAWESYAWNNSSEEPSIVVTETGWYSVQTEHFMGFIIQSDSVFLEVRPIPSVEVLITEITCSGVNNGAIELVNALNEEELTAIWNNNVESLSLSNLLWGNYIATVHDIYGCSTEVEISLEDPPVLDFAINSTDLLCFGDSSGQADVIWLSGNGEFSYFLNSEELLPPFLSLPEGSYEIEVINENGCSWSDEFEIGAPEELSLESFIEAEFWGDDGSIELLINGGTPPYMVNVNGIESPLLIDGISAGIYDISISDENGCQLNELIEVEDHTSIDELQEEDLFIYPNPSKDKFYISESMDQVDFELYSSSGQRILIGNVNKDNSIDLSSVPSGAYLLFVDQRSFKLLKD